MYRVFKAPKFQKKSDKLLNSREIKELDNFINELKDGKISGKRLSYDFFREKKLKGNRVYFLIYEDIKIILLISVSNKKYQQETIDEIKLFLPEFKLHAYELYSKLKK